MLRLSNLAGYAAAYPNCSGTNGDGVVAFGDINAFVALISNNPLPIMCP